MHLKAVHSAVPSMSPTGFWPAYNLFRCKRSLDLFCAVPEDYPVPAFDAAFRLREAFVGLTVHCTDSQSTTTEDLPCPLGPSCLSFWCSRSLAASPASAEVVSMVAGPMSGAESASFSLSY